MIVKHTKPFITYTGNIYFYPGNNEISEETAKLLMKEQSFRNNISCGLFEIIGEPKVEVKGKSVSVVHKENLSLSISKLPASKAIDVISEIYSIPELKRLQDEDPRKGVQTAISNQIDKIKDNDNDETEDKE